MVEDYGVSPGPTYLVVDGHGTVRARFSEEGALDSWNVPRIVKYLVAERAKARAVQAVNSANTTPSENAVPNTVSNATP
jgi:hypothetical protein